MNNKEIAKRLENEGYRVSHLDKNYIIAGILSDDEPYEGIFTLSSAFNITIQDDKTILEYANYQLSVEKEYSNLDEMIKAIKEKFPLKKE